MRGLLTILAVLSVWDLTARADDSAFTPSVLDIVLTVGRLLVDSIFLSHVARTISSAALGLLISVVGGVLVGITLGRSKRFLAYFGALVEVLRPIPSAAIIPFAIIFIGLDRATNVSIVAYGCFWPILLNTISASKSIGEVREQALDLLCLSRLTRLRRVVLPAALPGIFTGIRVASAISLILAITVEMILGKDGLGFFMRDVQNTFDYAAMYASLLYIGAIGLALNKGVAAIERRVVHWPVGA